MIDESKVSDIFSDFLLVGNQGGQDIKQLYDVMPYLNNDQQRVLTLYSTLAVKHDSIVLKEIVERILAFAQTNKKLGIHFKRNLEAVALHKHFQGYRATGSMNGDDK